MKMKHWFALLCLLSVAAFGRDPKPNHQVDTAQSMRAEEILIRTAYAKMSYADEVGTIVREVQQTSRTQLWNSRANRANIALSKRLSFQLGGFQFGKVSAIANGRMADFDGSPSAIGGEVLDVTPSIFNYRVDSSPAKYVTYAKFAWKPSPNQSLMPEENWTVAKALQEEQFAGKEYTDYVTYKVTLTFNGKSRSYDAWMLFGPDGRGQEQVYFMDPVVNSTGVLFASEHSVYPTAFAETELNAVPFINRWLYDNAQSCTARQNEKDQIADVCCDPQNGRCGVSRSLLLSHGFHRLLPRRQPAVHPVPASFHLSSTSLGPVLQSTDCSNYNYTQGFPDTQADTKEHAPGGAHVLASFISGSCTYADPTDGTRLCFAYCSMTSKAEPSESGSLSVLTKHHYINSAQADGASDINGGSTTCGATTAMSVVSCTFSCAVNLSISASSNGIGATVAFAPGALWNASFAPTLTCATRNAPCDDSSASGRSGYELRVSEASLIKENPCGAPAGSPIIIDTEGEGFHLTSDNAGVTFDISGTGHPVEMAWTDQQYHNAFLALPGEDGLIHNGKELFGNFTPQPPSQHPNGFIALAQYDKPMNGGNGDGIIDDHDEVFSRLRLWIDENHDGVCQPNELHRLPELGIYSLALNYAESRRTDEFGNQFRYKARVNPGERRDSRDETPSGEPGRWTYDVFFVIK